MNEKFPQMPANDNSAPENNEGVEGIEEVISEAKEITAELEAFKAEAENKHEVVVDMRTYQRIKKQQQVLFELFMNNPGLTKSVCGREKIYYDPRADKLRETRSADNDDRAPLKVAQ